MRAWRTRVIAVAFVGVGACAASCASGLEDGSERIASTRQGVHVIGAVAAGSSRKVCQLIGDLDFETNAPTTSQTSTRFGIDHTDLGYPVQVGQKTWFYFGDVTHAGDIDPLGVMDEKPSTDPTPSCPTLNFAAPIRNA